MSEEWPMSTHYVHVALSSRVELRGLSAVALNGKVGHVEGFDEESGRLLVAMQDDGLERKRVKPQNVVSAWEEGDHAQYRFRLSDDAIVCREHAVDACGTCCTDYALINQLRRKEIDGFDAKRAQVVRRAYFVRPAVLQHLSSQDRMPGLEQMLATVRSEGQNSGHVDTEKMLVLMAGLGFVARSMPAAQEQLSSMFEACLVGWLQDRDQNMRARTRALDDDAAAADGAAEIKRQRKERKEAGGKKTKSNQGPVSAEINTTQHVDSMMRTLLKAGVKEFGSFFVEYNEYGEGMLGVQDMLALTAAGKSGNDSIEMTPDMRDAITRCQTSMEFLVRQSTVRSGNPSEWPSSAVSSFLAESNVVPQ